MNYDTFAPKGKGACAFKAAIIPSCELSFDLAFRKMCESNACGNYGQCWMCPPDAGDSSELIAEAKTFNHILVYQTIGKLEDSYDFEGMMEAADKHNAMGKKTVGFF